MQLYEWLSTVSTERGSGKALVYRDTYLSWRGLLHRVDRRAQELHAMGIAPGTWVGLMLGNVPDFVILSLALSKIGAVVVPLDPTTGARELEMILEAAPLRALITRPRGGDTPTNGSSSSPGLPILGAAPIRPPVTAARPVTPVSKFVPESRRRLQGTLLTCSLYRRASAPAFTEAGAGLAAISAKTLDLKDTDRVLCAVALHHSYGFDLGFCPSLATGATLYLEDE